MRRPASEKSKSHAKHLRKSMTKPEVFLWTEFRKWREHGINVRRQVPVGHYIVDFVHLDSHLTIEVDGKSHDESRENYDAERQAYLESLGYQVLRVSNDDALFRTQEVVEHIWNVIQNSKS
ncbi:MAG: endonuclease domain-containing protein [Fimbriimonadaceae bacterium]|nr:endonuclease domain-containing protein [Fimbriimonadaceae bacterium]